MGRAQPLHHAFNRGEVDAAALARVDVGSLRLAAEIQENLIPFVIGKAQARPGSQYLATAQGNKFAQLMEFVFSASDTALLEFTDMGLRVFVSDQLITRPAVASAVTSGDFSSSTGWTLVEPGDTRAEIAGGVLTLAAPSAGGRATATQQVTVAAPDQGVEHGLRVEVTRGPVPFRVGSTNGGDDYVATTSLRTGTHSLSFTPTGDFYIQFESTQAPERIVDACQVEAAGPMVVPTPWDEASLRRIRTAQSGDVLFTASNLQQRRIERRGTGKSWSVVLYETGDGPFELAPSDDLQLTPNGNRGNITLTAERDFFKTGHAGRLLKLTHTSLSQTTPIAAADEFTEAFEVTGVGSARAFEWTLTGTWTATVKLQRSFDGPDSGFSDFDSKTANITNEAENDGLDNQSVWYRAGIKTGEHTSGTVTIKFEYPGGGGDGIVRVTGITSAIAANAEVVTSLKSTVATRDWLEGEWSDLSFYPNAVSFFDGRLWWAGRDRFWGSVSDAYESFSVDVEGDSGPILRNIATGAVNQARWMLPLQRLIIGTDGAEVSIRSSSFDEPLTPTNLTAKDASTLGVADVAAIRVDKRGAFIQRSGQKLYELSFLIDSGDYEPRDLTRLNDEIAGDGLLQIGVQRQPDTIIWMPRADGQCVGLLYEPAEEVTGWFRLITAPTLAADGAIESIAFLPEAGRDAFYACVKRELSSGTVHYIEKFANYEEAEGGAVNKMADAHVFDAGPVTTVTGLDHLEGETLVAWGNSKQLGTTFTVSSGAITLPESATDVCVGLAYDWRFKSAKLAYGSDFGSALLQAKRIHGLGLLMQNVHQDAVMFGADFDTLDPLPAFEGGVAVPADTVHTVYDERPFPFPGSWDTDSRICLTGSAPLPVTLNALVFSITEHDKR